MSRSILISLLIAMNAWGLMSGTYEEGQSYANSILNNAKSAVNSTNVQDVPGYKTDSPPEVQLDKNGNFRDAINQKLETNEAGQNITESANTRVRYKIDPKTDPLFKVQDLGAAETLLNISNEVENAPEEMQKEKTCEEGGEEVTYECFQDLQVQPQVPLKRISLVIDYPELIKKVGTGNDGFGHLPISTRDYNIDPSTFRQNVCPYFEARDALSGQTFNLHCERVQRYWLRNCPNSNRVTVTDRFGKTSNPVKYITVEFEHDTYEGEGTDQWVSYCDSLEAMVDEGYCHYGSKICSQKAEERIVQGYKVYKDCWQYRQLYHCKMIKDECSTLRAQGCHQTGSTCKEMRENKCWIYEQRYHCPNSKKSFDKIKSPPSEAFCLTGNCHDTSYQANGEMLEAISKLSVLKEVQNDIRAQQKQGQFQIFKGEDKRCSRNCLNFKDCCGGLKGWGVSLHLAGCKEEEKQLAKMREQDLCHQIGSFCSKKIAGKCVSKKTSFCCFGTKFARLLQEQGRPQLNLDWGSAECPNCRGLSVDELSKIDFSKLDFREVFNDVMDKYRAPNIQDLQNKTHQKIQENLKNLEQGLNLKEPKLKRGGLNGNESNL